MNRKRSSEGQAPLAHLGQGGNISKEFMWPGRSRGSLTPLVKPKGGGGRYSRRATPSRVVGQDRMGSIRRADTSSPRSQLPTPLPPRLRWV